jgi:peptide/nickel transport system permease protein
VTFKNLFPSLIVLIWTACALFGSYLPLAPNLIDLDQILVSPVAHSWAGFDELGRPVLDRLIVGARTSFLVAVSVVLVAGVFGTACGIVSAWFGGIVDHVVVRIMDVVLAFPGMLLAIALAGLLGPGLDNLVIALVAVGWVSFARLARAQSLSIKSREHVLAARALGVSTPLILFRHVLPLTLAPLIVEATFGLGAAIVAEAGLSFLGLGVQPPNASWGIMIQQGADYMLVAPHLVVAPAVIMVLVVLSLNVLGDALHDRLDVTRELAAAV